MVILHFVPNEDGQSVTARPISLVIGSADRATNTTRSNVILDRRSELPIALG